MTGRDSRWRAGASLLAAIAAVALLAPCLAGQEPILAVSSQGIRAPALRAALSLLPGRDVGGAVAATAGEEGAWVLRPPVAHDPLSIDLDARLLPPGRAHWLGTDELGRDILARLIHGARPSLLVAALATSLSLLLGIPVGAVAGCGGRGLDLALSRLIEASLSFPALVLLLLFSSLGQSAASGAQGGNAALSSLLVVGCAVGIARWGVIARYMRGEVLRLSRAEMALAARAAGAGPLRILGRHLIPAGMPPVAVSAAFGAGTAVIAEASLSFLGLGVQPPAPTWGQMIGSVGLGLAGARHWWLLIFPGAMVALTVGAFNLLGEGLAGPSRDR